MMGRNAKRRLASVMAFVLFFGLFGAWPFSRPSVAEAAIGWPASSLSGFNMPFGPADSLVTTQNPPDFRWPAISGADGYDLQVSRSASVTEVVYEKQNLTTNYYNFPHVFEAGTWYWRVKYHKPSEGWSEWSDIRKFRIKEQNVPFPVPPIEQIMDNVGTSHPRIWTNSSTLADFRNLAQTSGKTIYDAKLASVTTNLNATLPTEPTFSFPPTHPQFDPAYVAAQQELRKDTESAVNMMLDAAFIYLVTGSPQVGQKARERLLSIAGWDPNGATSYANNDMPFMFLTINAAIAYDWLYDMLPPSDKQQIQNMIIARTTIIMNAFDMYPIEKNPFDSHGWAHFGYVGIIATAMLHDIPAAEPWFRRAVPAFINMLPPWGGEDGGWSQGTGYWQWDSFSNKEFTNILLSATGFNLYDKAYSRNEGQFPLYAFPHGSPKGIFGDDNQYAPGPASVSNLNRLAQMYDDPRLKWASEAIGTPPRTDLPNYFYGDDSLAPRPPMDLPDARWFQDVGWVAMHSELYDPDRVSFYMKSSPYGSFNHSHADQNSFVLNAFGESLAIEAGAYDYYFSAHDYNYTKQTFASNAITHDGKQGQPLGNINADGKITSFVTHPDFDAAVGDAAAAYAGTLTKAKRNVIYVRPNMFVMVDQLQSPIPAKFEWRLHAEDSLNLDADHLGATILKGNAGLKVRFHAPASLETTYEDQFLDINGTEVKPSGAYANLRQKHAAFIAPAANAATFVSTMEAYERQAGSPQNVVAEKFSTYEKLTFADGSTVYVRLTDSGEIDAGSIRFNGTAVAVKGDTVLLVEGTKVVKNGITVMESSQPATIVHGRDRLSVSSALETQVAIYAPGIARLRAGDNGSDFPRGGSVEDAMGLRGVHWDSVADTLHIQAEKGQWDFKLNNAPIPQAMGSVIMQTYYEGVEDSVPTTLQVHTDTEGIPVAWGKLSNEAGLYEVVEAPSGFIFDRHGRPKFIYLEADAAVILRGAIGPLRLKRYLSSNPSETELWSNPDERRQTTAMIWQEAEAFVKSGGGAFAPNNQSFLSGGTGLGNWNQKGQWAKWNLTVPRSGEYDLVLKYAAAGWDAPVGSLTGRHITLGEQAYYVEAPNTINYGTTPEVWKGLRIKLGQQLNAGPIDLTMWHAIGTMNLDWIGLIERKDDELLPSSPSHVELASQTDTSVTVTWGASTDNVAVKEYAIYVDGVKKMVVPNGTLTATISGLTDGLVYSVTVRAVDTSDNYSQESNALTITMQDVFAPAWGETSSIRIVHPFNNALRLEWDPASDNSGAIPTYSLYRKVGSQAPFEKIATVTGITYDVTGLQPGGTYTFKVEATDAKGNSSVNGPSHTATLPTVNAAGEYFETFDDWATGNAVNNADWSFISSAALGTSISIVPLPDSNSKALMATDNYFTLSDEFAEIPRFTRTNTPLGGKVAVETKFKFSRLNDDVAGFYFSIVGTNTELVRFRGFADGTFGSYKWVNGVRTAYTIPKAGGFLLPREQWITLRIDLDMDAKTYGMTMQMDELKGYTGIVEAPGTLDRSTGVYRISGIPFYTSNSTVSAITSFQSRSSRYTSNLLFDYLTMYNQTEAPQIHIAAPPTVNSSDTFPVHVGVDSVTGAVYQDISLHYDANRFHFVLAESARAGTQITDVSNDATNGIVRIVTSNADPVSGSADLLHVSFQAKAGEGNGGIGVASAQIGSSSANAIEVNSLPLNTVTVRASKPADATFAANVTTPTHSDVILTIGYPVKAAVKEYKVGESGTWTEYTAPVVVSSNHTVYARGTDAVGNVSNVTSYAVSNIDKIAPVTAADLSPSQPDGPNGAYVNPVTVTLASTDSVSGVAKTEYSLDNGTTWQLYTSSVTFDKQGTYSFIYKSTDQAGNAEPAQSLSFTLAATAVKVQLKDSNGNPLSGGTVKYYDGGWKDFGITDSTGTATKSLANKSYTFRMTYQGTYNDKVQNTGTDALIAFQTNKVKVQLKDSQGNLMDSGNVKYYADGWKNFGDTSSGEISKELLAGSYTFGMTYEGTYNEKVQNTGTDATVVFQTVNVKVQLKDSQGNLMDSGNVKYYAGSWRTFGNTSGGETSKELLAGSYTFRMTYGGASKDSMNNIATNPTIVFQM